MYTPLKQLAGLIGLSLLNFQAISATYQVEVIIFENAHKNVSSEIASSNRYLKINPNAIIPKIMSNTSVANNNVTLLPDTKLTMNDIERKLKASSRKILTHTAWTQKLTEQQKSLPVRVQAGNIINTEIDSQTQLDGTLTLNLNRYIHVATDLQLLNETPNGTQRFHIKESRRMRSNDIHYVDHPAFGMIIKISPIPT